MASKKLKCASAWHTLFEPRTLVPVALELLLGWFCPAAPGPGHRRRSCATDLELDNSRAGRFCAEPCANMSQMQVCGLYASAVLRRSMSWTISTRLCALRVSMSLQTSQHQQAARRRAWRSPPGVPSPQQNSDVCGAPSLATRRATHKRAEVQKPKRWQHNAASTVSYTW